MVLANSHRVSPAPCYSGYPLHTFPYMYGTITLYGSIFQNNSISVQYALCRSYNPSTEKSAEVWAISCSLATTYEITIVFFSSGYLDVSVPRVLFPLWGIPCLQHGGLPHSDIHGSKLVCSSPQLIAAYHVLRRLQEPRHSPYALFCFLSLHIIFRILMRLSSPSLSMNFLRL